MVHDQATILELKSMFAEMKELLQQQVISWLSFKYESMTFPQVLASYVSPLTVKKIKKNKIQASGCLTCVIGKFASTFLPCFSHWFR